MHRKLKSALVTQVLKVCIILPQQVHPGQWPLDQCWFIVEMGHES